MTADGPGNYSFNYYKDSRSAIFTILWCYQNSNLAAICNF